MLVKPRRLGPAFLVLLAGLAQAAELPLKLDSALVIGRTGQRARNPLHTDALELQLVRGDWQPPRAGDAVAVPGGDPVRWSYKEANDDGWLGGPELRGGHVYWRVDSPRRRFAVLHARGHSSVRVNGAPRYGDPYNTGWARTPVVLEKGANHFLFRVGRGRLQAELLPSEGRAEIQAADRIGPDMVVGRPIDAEGSIVVANLTDAPLLGLQLRSTLEGGRTQSTEVTRLAPLAVMEQPFRVKGPAASGEKGRLRLELVGKDGKVIDQEMLDLDVRKPEEARWVTFRSAIDDSVQGYGLRPALEVGPKEKGLILSVHGAGVQGRGQANAYGNKDWAHVVAPTNRRPFGFDWEDWGRLDALEVLDHARRSLGTAPQRTWLTGHSMGGHGTWQLGVHFPDHWAAIGPSAGWLSFWSYLDSGRPEGDTPTQRLLYRAQSPSDTPLLFDNLTPLGIYILHGDADDNVPPSEAKQAIELLSDFHDDFRSHFEPGAGHWWNRDDEPGADCVDWAPMMDFFRRHHRLESPREVRFTTVHPGVSARSHWVTIHAQDEPLLASSVDLRRDPHQRRFQGTTENVARLVLNASHLLGEGAITIAIDGASREVPAPADGRLHLVRDFEDQWTAVDGFPPADKSPERAGSFKDAFRRGFVLVPGTVGSRAETAWALAKARFDADTFWYRANGRVEIVPDGVFEPLEHRDRNVILYGHADSNSAWSELLGGDELEVRRGMVRIGDTARRGDDLAVFAIRPHRDSAVASIGVVAGTGPVGQRLTETMASFVSGIHWPDVTVFSPASLVPGSEGVVAAGFFGIDWSVADGTIAWEPVAASPAATAVGHDAARNE
ncbi:MAG: prolyl oligopeptidase family serine peptidase [Acidobacteriota bacterium]